MGHLKAINQILLKALVRERLDNPAVFIGKPVIIWRSYALDGVNDILARDIFSEYMKCHSREERKGFMVNPKRAEKDKLGICFIDTSEDYSYTLAAYGDLPIVVYAFVDSPDESVLKDFPNAEQYVFAPDFQQWAEDTRQYGKFRLIADFIRNTYEKDSITYRWYNYFENTDISHRKGCDFPGKWIDGVSSFGSYLRLLGLNNVNDVDEDSFIKWFRPFISTDLIREFRQYVEEHNPKLNFKKWN